MTTKTNTEARRNERRQMRQLWTPKRKEMPEQCASCPFRTGNDAEFGLVIAKLCEASGERMTAVTADMARFKLKLETETLGDFICHQSAYDKDMAMRPPVDWRQCPGATRHHKDSV